MCYCNPSVRTVCCGKSDCFPKENKSTIQILKETIRNLEEELTKEQNNCEHLNIIYEYGANTGNYCEQDDSYWVDIHCIDCDKHMRFYNEDDPDNYQFRFKIGSLSKIKKEDYDNFLKIQKQLNHKK